MPLLGIISTKARVRARGHREVWKARKAGTYPYLDMTIQKKLMYSADGDEWVVRLDDETVIRSADLSALWNAVKILCRGHGWSAVYKGPL